MASDGPDSSSSETGRPQSAADLGVPVIPQTERIEQRQAEPIRVDRFRLEQLLGEGGMGMVYRAIDTESGEAIALKLVAGGASFDERHRQRFEVETELLRRLHHPNLVRILDAGVVEGTAFISMSFSDGRNLLQWIEEERPAPTQVAAVMEAIARGLDYAHTVGAVHRDVKPQNILIEEHDHPILIDFGIALDLSAEEWLSITDEAIGSPAYMSPEQARNRREDIGPQSDVWSLGVVLYRAFTGHLPFTGASPVDALEAVCSAPLVDPRRHRRDLPRDLALIIGRCLERDLQDRYPNARALADDLERFSRGLPVLVRPPSLARRLWRRVARHPLLSTALVLLLLTGAAFAYHAWHQHQLQAGRWITVAHLDGPEATGAIAWYNADLTAAIPPPDMGSDGTVLPKSTGAPPPWLWCEAPGLDGDVRVEIRCYIGVMDTIDVVLAAKRERIPYDWHFPSGWVLRMRNPGGDSSLTRMERAGWPKPAHFDPLGMPPDSEHLLVVERIDGRIRVLLDGEERLTLNDPLPLPGGNRSSIGLRYYQPTTILREVRVERMTSPELASPLLAAEELIRQGHDRDAMLSYAKIAEDHAGSATAFEARVRGYLLAQRLGDTERMGIFFEALRSDPHRTRRWNAELQVAEARWLWSHGQWAEALDLVEALQNEHPRRLVVTELLTRRRFPLPPDIAQRLLLAIARHPETDRLDLSSLGLRDVAPLAGLDLVQLDLHDNPIADLTPLASMPLQSVDLRGTEVRDLAPLTGLPIQRLSLDHSRVSSLAPLASVPLQHLSLVGCPVDDLGPLAGSPIAELILRDTSVTNLSPLAKTALRELDLYGCRITNLASLPASLERLDISRTPLDDLSDLKTPSLAEILLAHTAIGDLAPLAGYPLRVLVAADSQVRDLGYGWPATLEVLDLSGCPLVTPGQIGLHRNLRGLKLDGWPQFDLNGLQGLELERLHLVGVPVSDLAPLAGMPLTTLDLSGTSVQDLAPLVDSDLTWLSLDQTPVRELDALRGKSVSTLSLRGTSIGSLAPIMELPLEEVDLREAEIGDLAQLGSLQAKGVVIDLRHHDRAELDDAIATLHGLGATRAATMLELQLAAAEGDLDRLRSQAVRIGRQVLVVVPLPLTRNEAEDLAREIGVELGACDATTVHELQRQMGFEWRVWVDDRHAYGDKRAAVVYRHRWRIEPGDRSAWTLLSLPPQDEKHPDATQDAGPQASSE